MAVMSYVVFLILFVILGFLFFKLFKSVFKTVSTLITLIVIVGAILAVLIAQDAASLQEDLSTGPNLFLLNSGVNNGKNGKELLAAAVITAPEEFQPVNSSLLEEYNQYYQQEDFVQLLESNKRILLIKKEFLNIDGSVEIAEEEFTHQALISFLESDNALDQFAQALAEKKGIPLEQVRTNLQEQAGDDGVFKAQIFINLFGTLMEGKEGDYIAEQLRAGSIDVLPESTAVKAIKQLPQFLFEMVKKKISQEELQAGNQVDGEK